MKHKKRKILAVGTVADARHKGKDYRLEVVDGDAEGLAFRVGRKTYKSLSAAAKAITGYAVNGWVFWHLDPRKRPRARD